MSMTLLTQIILATIAIAVLVVMIISKRVHYTVSGLTLIAVGIFTLLFNIGKTTMDLGEFPVVNFAVYSTIIFASKDLVKEGFKEKESFLKYPSIILGILLVVLTTIPTLNKLHVIELMIPTYPPIIDSILYLISGIMLLIGAFTLLATNEE